MFTVLNPVTVGINRNIVECKGVSMASSAVMLSGINRNIVECKDKTGEILLRRTEVLIET